MVTRIFLCNEREVPEIRDYIREAKKEIAAGDEYVITWSCANIRSVQVGDKAFFKRADRNYDGYFASGYIVPAEKKYQLRLKDRRYQNISEAYDMDFDRNNFMVWIAWDECIDYDLPLRISNLKQIPEFSGLSFDNRIGGEVFPEEYLPILEEEWEYHLAGFAKARKSIRLVDMYIGWGQYSNKHKLHRDAVDYYSQAIEIKPNSVKAFVGLGNAHQALGEHKEAIAQYTNAIRLGSAYDKVAYSKRALSYYRLKEYKKAIRDYTSTLQIDAKYVEAHMGLGNSYYKLQQYQKAIAAFSKTCQLDPQNDLAFYYRGRAHFSLQEYEAAIRDFNHTLSLNAAVIDAYYYRGIAYSKPELDDIDTAIHDLREAAKLCKAQGKKEKYRKVQDMLELIASEASDGDEETPGLPQSKQGNTRSLPSSTSGSPIDRGSNGYSENYTPTNLLETEEPLSVVPADDLEIPNESIIKESVDGHKEIFTEPAEEIREDVLEEDTITKSEQIETTESSISIKSQVYEELSHNGSNLSIHTPVDAIAETVETPTAQPETTVQTLPARPERQRELDNLALKIVTEQYQREGWEVETVELRQTGYNLVCTKDFVREHVNVKGVIGELPMFTISGREVDQAQSNSNFVLWVVSSIFDQPKYRRWSGEEMLEKYDLKPVKYIASLKRA